MFRSDLLVFYCDPEVHGKEAYQKALETAQKARDLLPMDLSKDAKTQVLFTVSTVKNLGLVTLKGDKPEACFLKLLGQDSVINSLNDFMPSLKKIEGLTKNQFI